MLPETTIITCDYVVELVDDPTAPQEKEPRVIVLPPQSQVAADGVTTTTEKQSPTGTHTVR